MKKIWAVTVILVVLTAAFSAYIWKTKPVPVVGYNHKVYAGSESCRSCHQALYDSFALTAHRNDSKPASAETVKGSFEHNRNFVLYNNDFNRIVVMQANSDGLFQVSYIDQKLSEVRPFDIVIGSGTKGQSYLYWQNDSLYQLPASYYTPANAWMNSPGYSTRFIEFHRPISARCMECHSTYMKQSKNDAGELTGTFNRNQVILGITCERCHGPSADHVAFRQQNRGAKDGDPILRISTLSRSLQIDACAVCHAGLLKEKGPAFRFNTGDTLSRFFELPVRKDSTADVHGNQLQLLSASQCFIKSQSITCSTCHNVHTNERGNKALYSQKCQTCHESSIHDRDPDIGPANLVSGNCIDCHMPEYPSGSLVLKNSLVDSPIPAMVRSHLIGIYPEQKLNAHNKTK